MARHWAPWQEQWRVDVSASQPQFLPDASAVFALHEPQDDKPESPRLMVWETTSGKLLRSQQLDLPFKKRWMYAWPSTDSGFIFVHADEWGHNPFEFPEELRRCFWSCDLRSGQVRRLDLPWNPITGYGYARSPDGNQVLLWTEKEMFLLDVRQSRILVRKPVNSSPSRGVWAPNSQWLALKDWQKRGEETEYFVRVLDGRTLEEIARITQEPPTGSGYLLPLDDQRILVSCVPRSLFASENDSKPLRSFVFDARSGKLLTTVPGFVTDARVCQGRSVAVMHDDVGCYVYDLDRGLIENRIEKELPNQGDMEIGMNLTPNGRRVVPNGFLLFAIAEGPSEAAVYDAETGKVVVDLGISWPTVSADGRWITDEEKEVVRSTQSGTDVYRFPENSHVVFAPDGEHLVVNQSADAGNRFTLVVRRRPEQWWGLAWLHEFWLSLLLAGTFGWSCVLDRRQLSGSRVRLGQTCPGYGHQADQSAPADRTDCGLNLSDL